MGIHPREPKRATSCARLFRACANSMHKNVHRGAHECLQLIGLEQEVEELLYLLLVIVCNPRSERWPR